MLHTVKLSAHGGYCVDSFLHKGVHVNYTINELPGADFYYRRRTTTNGSCRLLCTCVSYNVEKILPVKDVKELHVQDKAGVNIPGQYGLNPVLGSKAFCSPHPAYTV